MIDLSCPVFDTKKNRMVGNYITVEDALVHSRQLFSGPVSASSLLVIQSVN